MAAKRKKKSRKGPRAGLGAIGKVGKITFLYFSGDVGEFLDAMAEMLKKPGIAEGLAQAVTVGAAAADSVKKEKEKADDAG